MNTQATLSHFTAAVETLQRADTWSAWKLGERESLPVNLDAPDSLDARLAAKRRAVGKAG